MRSIVRVNGKNKLSIIRMRMLTKLGEFSLIEAQW